MVWTEQLLSLFAVFCFLPAALLRPLPPSPVGQVTAFAPLNRKCFTRAPPAAGTVPGQQGASPPVIVAVVVQPFKVLQDAPTFVWTS